MKLCLLVQVAFSGNLFWFMTFLDEPGYWWQWCGVEQVQGQGPPHRKCGLCMVSFVTNCEFEILRLLRILDLGILLQNWNVFWLVIVHCWDLISLWYMSANLQSDTVIVLGSSFGCNIVKGFNNANMCFASSDVCSGLTTNNYTELAEIYSKYKNQGELCGTIVSDICLSVTQGRFGTWVPRMWWWIACLHLITPSCMSASSTSSNSFFSL